MSSYYLPPLTNTGILTKFDEKRLISSLTMLNNPCTLEQNVARYTLILLDIFFPHSFWNIVPQFYTSSGKIPDIVLETYLHRVKRERIRVFAASVYIEFKSELNSKDAIKQLVESFDLEYGEALFSIGLLIGVKGSQWTIMDYHFVLTKNNKIELLYMNFYDDKGNETLQAKRPRPSRQ